MGSGPSKNKKQQKSQQRSQRSDNVSKSSRQLKLVNNEVTKQEPVETQTFGTNERTQPVSNERSKSVNERSQFETGNGTVTTKSNNSLEKKNGNVKDNEPPKNLGNFESDSESEAEDISAVLEATKNEYNNKLREQNRYDGNTDSSIPETYAQRLQREQYRNEPQGIIRQKTIYRNPNDWEVDENEMESFDVSRFKQANVQQTHATEQTVMLNQDIYSPIIPDSAQKAPEPESNENYFHSNEKKQSLPHYDTCEEALLDEIEKEFDL